MATQSIPNDMLQPGDLVDVEYYVAKPITATQISMAIRRVKQEISMDPRFHYQGFREEDREEDSPTYGGIHIVHYVVFTVQVADPAKRTNNGRVVPLGGSSEPQEAGVGGFIIKLATLLTLLTGAIAAAGAVGAFIQKNYTITRIATDPNISEETKQTALSALGKSGPGIGSVVTAVIIIGVLWALSLGSRRGGAE